MIVFRAIIRSAVFLLGLFFCVSQSAFAQGMVQVNSGTAASASQVTVSYTQAQVSGDLNIVVIGWGDTTAAVTSVTDVAGNVYVPAASTVLPGQISQSIYFAKNISPAIAGGNAVTVTFSSAATAPDIRIAEYGGVDANNPLDAASGATGNGAFADSGAAVTAYAND